MDYYSEMSVQEAAQMIAGNKVRILDARDGHSYKADHIEGAMQAHSGLIEHLIKQGDYERPILVYCYQGKTSKDVATIFGRAGFHHCFSMQGGYVAWKKFHTSAPLSTLSEPATQWLVQAGFEPPTPNSVINGFTTPLMFACQQGNLDVAKELITVGANLEQINSDGNTALWAACYAENLAIIQLLLEAGAQIDHQNPDGASVLIYAASAGKTAVVELLVERGANVSLKTADDFTALDLAANVTILKLLKAKSLQLV